MGNRKSEVNWPNILCFLRYLLFNSPHLLSIIFQNRPMVLYGGFALFGPLR